MPVGTVIGLCLLGLLVAVTAHVASRLAELRARRGYRELVGEDLDVPDDGWQGIRPLAGRWGCLLAVLEFIRGLGVVVALAAALYLAVGR